MAIERVLDLTPHPPEPSELYVDLELPRAPDDRPYVYVNMVSTVDGKIVLGEPGGPAAGVGGRTDQVLFRRLQRGAEGALIGAGTLRASQVIYPTEIARFVATRSGNVPFDNRFFRDAPDRAFVISPASPPHRANPAAAAAPHTIEAGEGDVDWPLALRKLRQELGITRLLCEGGSELNDQLIRAGLVDELFLTVAPKIAGGNRRPTIVGGVGFPADTALPIELLSIYRDGSELYLRYRLGDTARYYGRASAAGKSAERAHGVV